MLHVAVLRLLTTPLIVTLPGVAPAVPGLINSAELPIRYTTIPLDFHPTVAADLAMLEKVWRLAPTFFEINRGRFPSSEAVRPLLKPQAILFAKILFVANAAVYPFPANIFVLLSRPNETRLVKKAVEVTEFVLVPLKFPSLSFA